MARNIQKMHDSRELHLDDGEESGDMTPAQEPSKTSRLASGPYKVRQVTNYQASWAEREPGEEGQFTLQLILDNGAAEEILQVDSDDLDIILSLLKKSGHSTFDLERRTLMFANIKAA